ncbi:MAG TPA: AroM family protein [Methylomirabilota bacterium]|nr:AroM family protein [Methylomirabilota bacterium]
MTTATRDRLGVLVIGQAPRPEIEAELRRVLGGGVAVSLVGALDGLRREEVDGLRPADSHDTLFTTLPDGSGVVLSKAEVTKRAQAHLDRLADAGIAVTLVNCTGVFEGLAPRGHLVFPSAVLAGLVLGLLPRGRLGVFEPLAEQEAQARAKWSQGQWQVEVVPLAPGTAGTELDAAARAMARRRPDLIVLDCMGYGHETKARVRAVTGIPTVLAISAAARAVQELLD